MSQVPVSESRLIFCSCSKRKPTVMQRRGRSLRLLLDRQGNGRRGNGVLSPSGLSVVSENDEDYDDDQPKAYVDDGEEESKEQEQGQGSLGKDEGRSDVGPCACLWAWLLDIGRRCMV
jgi:hypothetical protein